MAAVRLHGEEESSGEPAVQPGHAPDLGAGLRQVAPATLSQRCTGFDGDAPSAPSLTWSAATRHRPGHDHL